MKLFLNGIPLSDVPTGAATLEETLRAVQATHCRPRHLVIGVRCDGRDIPANEMNSFLLRPPLDVEKLEVFSSTKEQLVLSAMNNAANCLQESEQACRRVADMLNEGRTTEATASLGECLRVWQQIHDAVGKSIQMLEIDPEQIAINDEPFLAVIGKPKEVLLQIKQALKNQDHVLLADLLQFEFGEVTDQWFSVIARIRQEAEEASQAAGDAI